MEKKHTGKVCLLGGPERGARGSGGSKTGSRGPRDPMGQ